MKILDILREGVSSVLFHATTISNGIRILETDKLTTNVGFLSFTRSLAGEYHSANRMIGVIFEVDGQLLASQFSGKPVNGYHADYKDEDWYEPDLRAEFNQMEDRINAKEIVGFSRYVKAAIIYIPLEYLDSGYEDEFGTSYIKNIEQVYDLMKKLRQRGVKFRTVTSHAGLFDRNRDETSKVPAILKSLRQ